MMGDDLGTKRVLMEEIEGLALEYQVGEPIFTKEIKQQVKEQFEVASNDSFTRTVNEYLRRLEKRGVISKYDDGIYFRSKETKFGRSAIDKEKLIKKAYIMDEQEDEVIGYVAGAAFLSANGFSNNMTNRREIVTNNYNVKKPIHKFSNPPIIKKPKVPISKHNYRYFQLLDTLRDIGQYHVLDASFYMSLYDYMERERIDGFKLLGYAKKYYNQKVMHVLDELAEAALDRELIG